MKINAGGYILYLIGGVSLGGGGSVLVCILFFCNGLQSIGRVCLIGEVACIS